MTEALKYQNQQKKKNKEKGDFLSKQMKLMFRSGETPITIGKPIRKT